MAAQNGGACRQGSPGTVLTVVSDSELCVKSTELGRGAALRL